MAADSTNSMILAATANVNMMLERDYLGGLELAKTSVRTNRANPLGWHALSNAYLHSNDYAAGYRASVLAQSYSIGSRMKFWGDFQRSLGAAVVGRSEEALKYCTSAHALAPRFRPALRYLTLFNAMEGRMEEARRRVGYLQKLETDFTPDRLTKDKEYPVQMMHKGGLMGSDQIKRVNALVD